MASLNSSRTLGEVQDGVATQSKKTATKKITKLAKEAEELAKKKAEMVAPENSASARRSDIPPPIPSLSVQVDSLERIRALEKAVVGFDHFRHLIICPMLRQPKLPKKQQRDQGRPNHSTGRSLKSRR